MKKIYIQIMVAGGGTWDDIKPTALEVENPGEVAQSIATSTGCPVRLTYHMDGISDVGRLNGGYFQPKDKSSNTFFLSLKALKVVKKLEQLFPEMKTDEPISGSDAVDNLCEIWPEVIYCIDSSKKP